MSNGPTFEKEAGWGGQIGSWINNNKLWLLPAVAVVIVIIIVIATRDDSPVVTEQTGSPTPAISSTPAGTVSQTVVARDNYTQVARRMITTGTPGRQLYAETVLASQIKNQPLAVGATISIETSKIQAILDSYASLLPSQRTKWETMARNVKF